MRIFVSPFENPLPYTNAVQFISTEEMEKLPLKLHRIGSEIIKKKRTTKRILAVGTEMLADGQTR